MIQYLLNNYDLLYVLVGIIILSILSVHIPKQMKTYTFIAIALLFVETVVFHLERWSQTFETLSLLRPMMTASLYSLYPLMMIVMTRMTATKHIRLRFWLLMIPELVCVPIFFSSQWTHLVFYFSEGNGYHGGTISRLPYLLFGFYAVIFVISNAMYLRKYSRKNRLAMVYIVLGSIAGVLLYMLTGSEKDYSLLFALAMLLYYTFMYIHMARIDPLTALLNRQCFYKDIEIYEKSINGAVSVDMNYLKYFNDYLGHEAGDKALKTVSAIMRDYCGKGAMVYRIGGDEFVILYINAKEQDVLQAIKQMQEKMAETEYMCAFGYAMKEQGGKLSDALRKSDEMMYIDKEKTKKEHPLEITMRNTGTAEE